MAEVPPPVQPGYKGRMISRRILLLSPLLPMPAQAQGAPSDVIERFHAALIAVMRDAQRLGVRGRYDRLAPILAQSFDLAAMTRIAVGPLIVLTGRGLHLGLLVAVGNWVMSTAGVVFMGAVAIAAPVLHGM